MMAAPSCIGTPISWLRLERFALGEIDLSERTEILSHTEKCSTCSSCLDVIAEHRPVLAPLPAIAPPTRAGDGLSRLRAWLIGGGVVACAVAVLLLIVVRDSGGPELDAQRSRVAIKGGDGDLVLTLIRRRGVIQTFDPEEFRNGDRFKVAITCSEQGPVELEIVVLQGADLFRPLGSTALIRCGNNVEVPGAFTADGAHPITVCVAPAANRMLPLAHDSREGAACTSLKSSSFRAP